MTKQRDTFANEIGILKKLLQVNGIAYHASPLAIDTIAQNHTYGGVNPYTGNELSFATAPQPNGTIASQLNGYPAPASNYSSSIDTASLNNGMGAEVSPEMTSMSFNSTLSTNGSMSEGHTPQLSPATTADLPSSTIMAPSSSGNGYMNGYVYDSGNNFTTSSTDLGYSQAVASANTALMMTNGNSYNTGSLDRHIGQLEMQLGNHRQLYSSQTNGNLGFQNTSAVYGVPDFDLHQWSYNFVVA